MHNGTVVDIEAQMVNVKVGAEVRRVAFHDLELLPPHEIPTSTRRHDDTPKPMTSTYSAGNQTKAGLWLLLFVMFLIKLFLIYVLDLWVLGFV